MRINLPAGSMIKSKEGVGIHVAILLGYPREFVEYLTDDEVLLLDLLPDRQYVINMRNLGGGFSAGSGASSGSGACRGAMWIEELNADSFKNGVAACPFRGDRDTFEDTVRKAIELWREPGDWSEYDVLNRNCQHFATYVATKGEYCGLVLERRKNVHEIVRNVGAGTFVAGVLLAPVTGRASLAAAITGWGVGFGSDVFCVASEWLNKDKFNPY